MALHGCPISRRGTTSEFLPVSPIVGTVNLKNANNSSGGALPNTDITANPGGQALPQRSNMMITAGFSLPGFEGRLRAFRTYRPVADPTKPTGWKFINDGTRLWPDLDGRPWLAGLARVPADPTTRNIYTYVPNGAGGGSVVSFDTSNAATLEPHLRTTGSATTTVINFVRSAVDRRHHRLDAGADGSAISGSAAGRRLRTQPMWRHRMPASTRIGAR